MAKSENTNPETGSAADSSPAGPGAEVEGAADSGIVPDQIPEQGSGLDLTKQIIGGILTIAVLAFVFLGIFPKFADYGSAWKSIQNMSVGAVVALAAATIINIGVYVLPYQAALPGIAYRPAFVVRQTSFMISNVIPAGGAFGLGIQYAMLSGYNFGPAETTTAIAATSIWNLMVTLGLPVLGLVMLVLTGNVTAQLALAAVAGVVILGLLIGALAVVLRSDKWAHKIGGWGDWLVLRFRPSADPKSATDALVKLRDTVAVLVQTAWQKLTVTSTAQQLCQFSILAVAFYAIAGSDGGLNLAELFAAFAMARLAGFIPITPGGLGTVDAALVGLMVTMGADENQALAADLVWRALSYFPQVFLGIFTFLWWRHKHPLTSKKASRNDPHGSGGVPDATVS